MNIRSASKTMATAGLITLAAPVYAAEAPGKLHIAAQPLGDALRALARARQQEILFSPQAVTGKSARALDGVYTTREAVAALLDGSGLVALDRGGSILVMPSSLTTTSENGAALPAESAIVVTGSRIKGAPLASQVLQIGREDVIQGGFADLGGALRALPQNFAGGQNPGVGAGANAGGQGNQNITGGSSVNLRGLGGDATLTLLNGNRLSYGGFSQGVDISAIPLDAIERIDVVADGASAIYGSDAVAGVVNVVLRAPYDGVTARARLGQATQGGDFSQAYALTGGRTWSSGSVLAGFNVMRNTDIQARQRDYAADLGTATYMLYPEQRVHSGLLRLSQDIGTAIRLSVDGLWTDRKQTRALTTYGQLGLVRTRSRTLSLAPGLHLDLGGGWSAAVRGVYSRDRAAIHDVSLFDGAVGYEARVCYCNALYSGEVYLAGPLFDLPGGAAKLVAGGGHRSNKFRNVNLVTRNGFGGAQRNTFAYGELFVPLVGADNARSLVHRLSLSLAGRYDRYNVFGGIVTPKLGLIYGPTEGVDLKFSWGRSFKAPTLLQQLQARSATLIEAATLTGSDAAAGASALYTGGGSTEVGPERANSLSWTASLRPTGEPGLTVDLTYFRVRYDKRVLQPISNFLDSLNPSYASFVTRSPTLQQVEAALANSDSGLDTYGNVTRDLSRVAYIIDNHYTNIAGQKIQGIDASLSYRAALKSGALSTSLNATWLHSRQQTNTGSAYYDLSGTIWNPARYRARASVGWEHDGMKLIGYLNYVGKLEDRRLPVSVNVRSTVTADLFIGYSTGSAGGVLRDVDVNLSVENLFDTKPAYLRAAPYVEPYDSTNYSPVGRFIAVSVSKSL